MASLLVVVAVVAVVATTAMAADPSAYGLGPDSQRQAGVPHGRVVRGTLVSQIYPDAVHAYAAYVPAQYDPAKAACVMVFQDGGAFVDEHGDWRAPVVFDNLIARGQMPVTVGVFVDPGTLPAAPGAAASPRSVRSYEYDAVTDRYGRFLLDELLPAVAREQHLNLSTSGNDRGIAGLSSGGVCAFTAAWFRPDAFSRVGTFIGSFTDLRGGNAYPDWVRKAQRKPIRVSLQSGEHDMNVFGGTWSVANHDMAAAFTFAGNDHRFDFGTGGHNGKHGGSILPDVLRWLWRGYPEPVGFAGPSHQPVTEIVDDGDRWQLIPSPSTGEGVPDGAEPITLPGGGQYRVGKGGLSWRPGAESTHQTPADRPELVGTTLALAPDHGLLAVGRGVEPAILACRLGADGHPGEAFPFYVRQPMFGQAEVASPVVFDTEARLYAGSRLGVQVFDQAGRVYAILNPPVGVTEPATALAFGGEGRRWLYARFGDQLYRCRTKVVGSPASDAAKPVPPPKL